MNLICDYDLGGETLYSVKWYKDDKEFYRYMPQENKTKRTQAFKLPGVNLDVSKPKPFKIDLTSVRLGKIDFDPNSLP